MKKTSKKALFNLLFTFSGAALFGQNVGINTPSPDMPLSILANGAGDFQSFKNAGGTTKWSIGTGATAGLRFSETGQNTTSLYLRPSSGGLGINSEGLATLDIFNKVSANAIVSARSSGFTTRFQILDNGQTMLGTTTPAAHLTVENSSNSFNILRVNQNAGGTRFIVNDDGRTAINGDVTEVAALMVNNPNNHPGLFVVKNNAGVKALDISQDGRVGFYGLANNTAFSVRNAANWGNIASFRGSDNISRFHIDDGAVHVENGADFEVTGGGTKLFRIDHPLDPENKILNHVCPEAPEPLNFYRGHVVCGADGAGWAELPDYFGALNIEFEYQLTCVGGHAPVFIEKEIEQNRFRIAGGKPGLKVSWQVTGRRNDPGHRLKNYQTVIEKTAAERGKFYAPAAYGKSIECAIGYEKSIEK